MKRFTIPLMAAFIALMFVQTTFDRAVKAEPAAEPQGTVRQRYQDMSAAEKERFRADVEERRRRFENMSKEEREKFRAQMRERFGSGPQGSLRQRQLEAIADIETQLAKLKAAVESLDPNARSQFRDLPEAERSELRNKMAAALRQQQASVVAIEEKLDTLKLPGRRAQFRPSIDEIRAIHSLAVKEKASETAKSIERLMAQYGQPPAPMRPADPALRRDRPPRPGGPGQADAGKPAKPFTLRTFDGKTVSLADYRGKTIVLEWLNTECPFSMYHYDTTHTMIDLANKYKDKGVVWLAINSTSHTTPAANQAFVAKHDLPYPLLDDRSGKVGRAYEARTTPHVFVVAPGGNIVYDGAIDNSPMGRTLEGQEPVNYVDKVLADLLAGKDVSVKSTKSYGCSVKYAQ